MQTSNKRINGNIHTSAISPLHSVSRPETEQVVRRKKSVSDLIGRLTQPTNSSRQKMKPPRRAISGAQPGATSPGSGKRSFSHNDVVISRPIPLPKQLHPLGRSLSKNSLDVQLASRRKAPSPPDSVSSSPSSIPSSAPSSSPSPGSVSSGKPNNSPEHPLQPSNHQPQPQQQPQQQQPSNHQPQQHPQQPQPQSKGQIRLKPPRLITNNLGTDSSDSLGSFRNYGTPPLESPVRFNSPTESVKRNPRSRDTENPIVSLGEPRQRPAGARSASAGNPAHPGLVSPSTGPSMGTRANPLGIRVAQSPRTPTSASPVNTKILPLNVPKPPNLNGDGPNNAAGSNGGSGGPNSGIQSKKPDMNASSYLGHKRRLSAPAPMHNVTTPRAMSHIKGGGQSVISPPVSPAYDEKKGRRSTGDNSIDSSLSYRGGEKTPLSSLSPSPEFKTTSPLHRRSSHSTTPTSARSSEEPCSITPSGDGTVNANGQLKPKIAHFSASDEVTYLKNQNRKVKMANRMMKARIEDLMSSQDQLTAELAICQASRNSLDQQVKGYDAVQLGMENKIDLYRRELVKYKSKVAQLRTLVQELKISLEEKDMENYALSRKRFPQ